MAHVEYKYKKQLRRNQVYRHIVFDEQFPKIFGVDKVSVTTAPHSITLRVEFCDGTYFEDTAVNHKELLWCIKFVNSCIRDLYNDDTMPDKEAYDTPTKYYV